jgi:transcriptional regulator with XRE-family HTH domain
MERGPGAASDARTPALRAEIRAYMRREGLSMRALALRVGVNHTTLSRFLAGRTTPSPRLLAALAPHLGIGLERLLALARQGDLVDEAGSPAWGLPDVGPEEFRATLDRLAAMAGGSEVEGLLRAGYGPKRALLAQSGMAGPSLGRLDGLYDLYVGRVGPPLPPALRSRVAGALLYFVLSVDGIPDDLFPVGYLDDAWVAELVWREVEAFQRANASGHGTGEGGQDRGR